MNFLKCFKTKCKFFWKKSLNISLPEDEAGFLAMHIVNGTLGSG
ncbi:PRD domain-containing protein, partial [Lactococcus lactis]